MHVVVGSGNPVKRRAVATVAPEGWTVSAAAVDPGVPEQPRGHEETRRGAENRARNAVASADRSTDGPTDGERLGVGVEGGVARLDGCPGLYLVNWTAASDGGRVATATGPSFPLPDGIARRVEAGEELGPVMDDELGESDVKKRQGAAGVFTAGMVDREASLATGVAAALGPFVAEQYG